MVTLEFPGKGLEMIRVFDCTGSECFQQRFDHWNSRRTLDLTNLAVGIYWMEITVNAQPKSVKLIISE